MHLQTKGVLSVRECVCVYYMWKCKGFKACRASGLGFFFLISCVEGGQFLSQLGD